VPLGHFSGTEFSFDHPAIWPILAQEEYVDPIWTIAAFGTGEWRYPCQEATIHAGLGCQILEVNVDPGEYVVSLTQLFGGPALESYPVPPFTSTVTPSGLAAITDDGPAGHPATVFVPGEVYITIDEYLGGPDERTLLPEIDALVDSLELVALPPNVDLDHWHAPTESCSGDDSTGRLARGTSTKAALIGDEETFGLVWPEGWSARFSTDGRMEILNQAGSAVATEWDEVKLRGQALVDERTFRVCDIAVEKSFPTE